MNRITWNYYRQNWKKMNGVIIWLLVAIIMDTVAPVVTKLVAEATSVTIAMVVMTITILIVSIISLGLSDNYRSDFTWDFVNKGRSELYRLLAYDTRNFPNTNDLISFVQNDALNILMLRAQIVNAIIHLALDFIIGVATIWYFLNFGAVIIISVVSVVIIMCSIIPHGWAAQFDKDSDLKVAKYRKVVSGFAILLRDYRLNSSQEHILTKIDDSMEVMSKAWLKSEHAQNWANSIGFGLRTVGIIVVVIMGQWMIQWFNMTTTEFLIMTQYLFYILMPLYSCIKLYNQKVKLKNVEDRVAKIIDFNYDENEADKDKLDLDSVKEIEFKNAKYTVNTSGGLVDVLNGIVLKIKSKMSIGVVGKTGSGKSTLIKSLYRAVDITSGELLINGRPITEYKRRSIFKAFFIVEQEAKVIEGTIKENLQSAKQNASDAEMKRALEFAELTHLNLDELIEGEGGRSLSGGEKQRLAFAKLFLRPEVSVVILDEATSALDEDVQFKILRKISNNQFKEDRIIISIAHRLSTIENSDKIVVVSDGRIAESGNHDELMSIENGYYRMLVNASKNFKNTIN